MRHEFVEFIPKNIEEDKLYISIEYNVAKHKCPCGCGTEIVTSLSPVGWKLIYNGDTVSLEPSIGNWQQKCKSHYFIKNDQVVWAGEISESNMEKVIYKDIEDHQNYYKKNILERILGKIFGK
jgi:hypothetical protein